MEPIWSPFGEAADPHPDPWLRADALRRPPAPTPCADLRADMYGPIFDGNTQDVVTEANRATVNTIVP